MPPCRLQVYAGLERILDHGQRLVQQGPACGRERDQLLKVLRGFVRSVARRLALTVFR